MRLTLRWCLGVLLSLAAFHAAALAQESTAELRGRALDAQGAAVSGVTITITNQATGVYRADRQQRGRHLLRERRCRPACTRIVAELSGLQEVHRASDVRLDLGHTTTLDLTARRLAALTGHGDRDGRDAARGRHVETDRRQRHEPRGDQPAVGERQLRRHGRAPAGHRRQHQHRVVRRRTRSASTAWTRATTTTCSTAPTTTTTSSASARARRRARRSRRSPEFQVVTNQYDAEFGRTTGAIINAISKQGSERVSRRRRRRCCRTPSMTRPRLLREAERPDQARHAASRPTAPISAGQS